MAWECSGVSNRELVNNLLQFSIIKTPAIHSAMLAVDRANYAPTHPYDDSPQRIGHSVTISAPHMHAHALELLYPSIQNGGSILDVGCGSGYLLACLGRLSSTPSPLPLPLRVFGIDVIPELVALTERNLRKSDGDLLNFSITIDTRDGWEGWNEHAPFNAIHVGAAAATVPTSLVSQLAPGGVMIIPVGPDGDDQELLKITKKDDDQHYSTESLMGVRYVPLVQK